MDTGLIRTLVGVGLVLVGLCFMGLPIAEAIGLSLMAWGASILVKMVLE